MRYLLIVIILLTGTAINAQTLHGVVVDAITGKPLPVTTVVNLTTQVTAYSNENGQFAITANSGDKIGFTYVGYKPIERIVSPGTDLNNMKVLLLPMTVNLKELTVHPDYTPYQKDSIAMRSTYGKELEYKAVKPHFGSTGEGVGMSGLLGSVVQHMSRSYKQMQKFKKEFKSDEEQKFIDTRYTPELVHSLTGFSGDSLAVFMNTYPMDYDYARVATDLELKMWIRNNYKQYLQQKDTTGTVAGTGH